MVGQRTAGTQGLKSHRAAPFGPKALRFSCLRPVSAKGTRQGDQDRSTTVRSRKVAEGLAGLDIERRVLEGNAPRVLLERGKDADVLVVGSRGFGGFRGVVLASVSQQCV
jgi:nucleotide-binding universal stress UspA family protein